ncbi:methionyl-tRNA formyltransferase [Sodalis sp. CWE]|uniref:methionyl-tRNA formyltransferase n=1 Tax=Sodalis sp. CWE TaxID=2803816 RepID=UPI001C7CC44E|nr:methionyl-tRNA formyltransferase [Sodalis sp. CWE]MBX4180859.1 methionyl-tRNA formyltransferase [Sodalis sp. CWE]
MSNFLRIIFAGTSNFSACCLSALINAKHQIVGVFTKPDKSIGCRNRFLSNPVKLLANQHNLFVFQPTSLSGLESQKNVAKLDADIMIVVAYGLILPQSILELPKFGCINVHGSLLPNWRGAAPIQRALLAGDNFTGITVIQMDTGVDTGAILNKTTCIIEPTDTSYSLCNKLAKIGAKTLLATIKKITDGCVLPEAQDNSLATYAKKISKKEARLDWSLPASHLERCIRAFNPWPISYFFFMNQSIKVWSSFVKDETKYSYMPGTILGTDNIGIHIATGKGVLTITRLQPPGKRIMKAYDFLNSRRKWFLTGTVLP